ncbi:peroxisomal (S)-2-hydroxyacid oxidase GLO4-like [Solanum verrucosum]|uniref:peroxisomal (S)-2-hydroxyacid oxidase GLO4-like n=1 Tax=Solanum verrucosum TaxID=315347 RepID=UPI0020D0F6AB|nr:peroxisomal (S)-2-hydroxyacid oxidase GLO4-like [Solanum verrucosum]
MAGEPVNVNEFEELARQALPNMYYDFFAGGSEDQYTLEENIEAFRRIIIRPRILVDVSRIDMSTVILGHKTSAPIMIAPTMMHKFAHPEGEIATARGAASCDVIAALKREITEHMVRQAESNGFRAIILTTDTPALGRRKADITNKMIAPQLRNFEGLLSTKFASEKACAVETLDRSFFWKEIAWLKSVTKLPILIKGILTSEDAMKAIEAGVAGIIVSNHGARQLDYTPATVSVLEEVVHVVQGKVPVLIEGGIRRGTDIFKALALGAKAVLIGRPVIYGLAAKGESGVKQVIEMLKNELEQTMALAGCCTVADITRNYVKTEKERFLGRM